MATSALTRTTATIAAICGAIGSVVFSASSVAMHSSAVATSYQNAGFSSDFASRVWWWHATLALLSLASAIAGLGTIRGASWGPRALVLVSWVGATVFAIAAIAVWFAFATLPQHIGRPVVGFFPALRVPLVVMALLGAGTFAALAWRLSQAQHL